MNQAVYATTPSRAARSLAGMEPQVEAHQAEKVVSVEDALSGGLMHGSAWSLAAARHTIREKGHLKMR